MGEHLLASERIRMRIFFLLSAVSSALAAPFFASGSYYGSGSAMLSGSGSSMRSGSAPDYSGYASGPDYGSDYGSGSFARSGSEPDYSSYASGPDYDYSGSGNYDYSGSGSDPDYSGFGSGPDYGSDYGSGSSMRSGSAPDY